LCWIAGGELGSAIARGLAREGAHVVLAGRHAQSVHEVAGGIISTGGKALAVEWDISDLSAVGDRANEIEKDIGWVDILVNNSGGPPPTPAAGQDIAVWQAQYRSMVLSVIAITDRVLPRMRQRGWGRIITSTRRAPLRQRSTPQRLATRRLSPHSGTQPGAATSPRRATLPPCNPTPPHQGDMPGHSLNAYFGQAAFVPAGV
jgi:NAD(P)-dependent dehydrogenase (short-subunit alcohol dehydrogenase family)